MADIRSAGFSTRPWLRLPRRLRRRGHPADHRGDRRTIKRI